MNLLLDTHALVWWDDNTLPPSVVKRVQRAGIVYVSAVTAWEIAIKSALGKMTARGDIATVLADYGFTELPISIQHAEAVRALPAYHRDPFDRLLVAQALVEDVVLLSSDRAIKRYPIAVVWE